jgi:Calx-beta domain-containing protein
MKRLLLLVALTAGALILVASPAFAPCHSITFANDPYSVAESAGKVTISVSNGAGAQTQDQFVDYKTVNGTAKAGSDFVGKSGTVMFGANSGASELSFDIVIKDDNIHENTESFTVQLSNVRPPSSCAPPPSIDESSATVTIRDNDKLIKPKATPTHTPTPTPTPTKSSPKPSPKATTSPSPSPSPTITESPTPTTSAIAAPSDDGGRLGGGAVAGIVIGSLAVAGAAAFFVRRRFLT